MSRMLDAFRDAVFVFLLFFVFNRCSSSASCPANSFLENKRLYNFMFMKTSSIGPNMCEHKCLRMKDCKSFNYNLLHFECELNTAIADSNWPLVTKEHFFYGDKKIGKLTGPCGASNCAAQEECIKTSSSSYVCIVAGCGAPENIPNSEPWIWPPLQHFGNNVKHNCSTGYVMVGTPFSVCRPSGQWSQPGSCEYDCGPPTALTGETVSYSHTYTNSFAIYTCKNGYAMTGSGNSLICNVGGWSVRQFSCIIDCGAPPVLVNGISHYTSTILNSVVTYQCSTNYVRIGPSTITCETSGWPALTMNCTRDCGEPTTTVANAVLGSGSTLQGSSRTYTCASGYQSSNAQTSIVCQAHGYWSSPTFQCIDRCPSDWVKDTTYNTCYKVYPFWNTYDGATISCYSDGATLLSLKTVAQRDAFFAYLQTVFHHQIIYIGGRTFDWDSGVWHWPDGSVFYHNSPIWKHDEPKEDKNCAFVHHEREIKSTECTENMLFACEIAL